MRVDRKVRDRQGARVPDGVPDRRSRAPRREDGDGAGRGEPRRAGEGARGRRLQGEVRRALHDARRDARRVRAARLVARRGVPDAQPDAPLARVPREGRDRDLRRRARPFAARQPEAGRHPGRGAHAGDRRAAREVLPPGHGRARGLSARHALRRPARGAAARALPPELRLLAPAPRPRSRRGRQLLRAVRRAPDLRRDPGRTRSRPGR